ncbi:uncharacterized protein CDAR_588031 [Caerostris darwini]|uniref:Granulins domain-containing protein n=1 Tax=Caerostris darwini TaxID=1538125 RepID=A0AAV4Q5P9_9ARAC|nr:uncharacterized protein CDAR_588031 [Caerostris darwini]
MHDFHTVGLEKKKVKYYPVKLSLTAALLLLGVASALPNEMMSALKDMPDLTQPENTMMGQSLKEMGVEICPDKLHLCPATADCCKKEDGKWDCCPKTAANAPNNIFLGKIAFFRNDTN